MLAHCAKTVEEEMVPAVAPPAARARDEGSSKALTPGGQDNDGCSRKEKSLRLLCDKFLQEYSSAAKVIAAFALWSAFWLAWERVLLPVSCALWS
jgi:hypothetical protein